MHHGEDRQQSAKPRSLAFLAQLHAYMYDPRKAIWMAAQDLWVALGEPPLPPRTEDT